MWTSILIIGLLASQPDAQATRKYDTIIYRLDGDAIASQGTIEMWIRPDGDLTVTPASFYHFFVFRLSFGPDNKAADGAFTLAWLKDTGLGAFGVAGSGSDQTKLQNLPVDRAKKAKWKQGEWHHVAFTWQGTSMAIYADGKLIADAIASEPMPSAKDAWLIIGQGSSEITVDSMVVSKVALPAARIAERWGTEPVADDDTLLLDPMETLERQSGRHNRLRPDRSKLIDGKFSKAVQLHDGGNTAK